MQCLTREYPLLAPGSSLSQEAIKERLNTYLSGMLCKVVPDDPHIPL